MLKNILKLKGVQQLNKNEQRALLGGDSCLGFCAQTGCPPGQICQFLPCVDAAAVYQCVVDPGPGNKL